MEEEIKTQQVQNEPNQAEEKPAQEAITENQTAETPAVLSDEEKSELEEFRKWKESQKSESEKQAEAYQKSEKARIEAETKVSDYEAKFTALKSGVSAESVDDVIALVKSRADKNKTLEQCIAEIVEKYPQFLGRASTTGVKTGNNGGCQLSGVEQAFLKKNPDIKI